MTYPDGRTLASDRLPSYSLIGRLQELVAEFTYKPGFRFEVRVNDAVATCTLVIECDQVDARTPEHGVIPITVTQHLDRFFLEQLVETPGFFDAWFRDQIIRFELHELDEWLLKKGKFVRNPHPGGPDAPLRTRLKEV